MSKGQYANALGRAGVAAEFYLASTSARSGMGLFCWGVASVYGKEDGGADTAVWLGVVREEVVGGNGRFPWLVSPRRGRRWWHCGRWGLDEVIETTEGLVIYLAGLEAEG